MIRKATASDINKIMQIWLEASTKAHDFIGKCYWEQKLAEVRDVYLPQAETFIYEDKHQIKGFVSVILDNFIGALFVDVNHQNKGVGGKLLNYVRQSRPNLTLRVYAENKNAIKFYQKQAFKIVAQKKDDATGQDELILSWALGCKSGHFPRVQGDS